MRELPRKTLLGFIVAFIMTSIAEKLEAKYIPHSTQTLLQRYIESSSQQANVERVGAALNVLPRFGDLSLIFHTVPRNDIERWLFREELHPVMKNVTVIRNHMTGPPFQFQIILCKSIKCILRSYFRRFRIKGVEESWKAFSASWSNQKICRTMGISEQMYNDSDSGFAILKLEVLKDSYKLKNTGEPLDRVRNLFDNVAVNDANSIVNFHKNVGTHYIESFTTGDFLFQVLRVNDETWESMRRIKERAATGAPLITSLQKLLNPQRIQNAGKIMVASGDAKSSEWVKKVTHPNIGYDDATLIQLVSSRSNLAEFLSTSRPNAIVQLQLNLLEDTLNSTTSRKHWYEQVTHSLLALMENNI